MRSWVVSTNAAGRRARTRTCGLLTQEVEQTSELLWVWRLVVEAQADEIAVGRTTILQGTSRTEQMAKIAARMATSLLRESASALEGQDA